MLLNISLAGSVRMVISTRCCYVLKMLTDWHGLPTIWMVEFRLQIRLPLLLISHLAAKKMCMKWLLILINTRSRTEACRPGTRCRYVCPLSLATCSTDSIAPPSTYLAIAPATATSTLLSLCPLMLRSFIVW